MPHASVHCEWSDDTIARLRILWDEGQSTAEIGRRLGISKNAVVGKAHRLDLPGRPSPVRRIDPNKPGRKRSPPASNVAEITPARVMAQRPVQPPPPKPIQPIPSAAASRPIRLGTALCCWPIGEPGTRDFRFCNAWVVAGKPYCETHCALAYRKSSGPDQEAAA